MPNPAMPNTFVAMGHDIGDPASPDDWGLHGAGCRAGEADHPYQMAFDNRPLYQSHGIQYYTNYFMGPIHPRAKQFVGRRLAAASFSMLYPGSKSAQAIGDAVTGPLIAGCKTYPDTDRHEEGFWKLTILFNSTLLGTDAVHVWKPTSALQANAIGMYVWRACKRHG